MNRQKILKMTLTLALLILVTMTGCAKSENHRHSHRQRPPAEAIEACKGKRAGDIVEFTGRNGETIKASCKECNGQLVAVPDEMPHGGDRSKYSD